MRLQLLADCALLLLGFIVAYLFAGWIYFCTRRHHW